ncbi:DUF4336 domain-containing protein [Roseibium salinum]|nr:DUF4336 domain-containing protein [Roseibium salinum]
MDRPAIKVAENIWILEGDLVPFYGYPYPTRCVIVALPSGGLWVWSPIALSDDVKRQIETLGAPAHLVSPNKIHHLYLQDWQKAYPDARLWGPQSTIDKRRDLTFEAPLDDTVPAAWDDRIDMVRFAGSPVMDELVFFHRPSRTAILADLSEHFFPNASWPNTGNPGSGGSPGSGVSSKARATRRWNGGSPFSTAARPGAARRGSSPGRLSGSSWRMGNGSATAAPRS